MRMALTTALLLVFSFALVPSLRGQGYAREPLDALPPPPRLPQDFQGPPKKEHAPKPVFDAAKASKRAKDLADLANQIPDKVNQVSHGVLPKDLIRNLKQIEKLAKQLRRQVSR
jgi:hypothetical protein